MQICANACIDYSQLLIQFPLLIFDCLLSVSVCASPVEATIENRASICSLNKNTHSPPSILRIDRKTTQPIVMFAYQEILLLALAEFTSLHINNAMQQT